ncbi:MAG TPA: glycosyltransferase family 2 protein [Gemmataceae bacterium]|nr:glycosyltransferase family 2 protein [Gemmataceae bacterium]
MTLSQSSMGMDDHTLDNLVAQLKADPDAHFKLLRQLLGEGACRQLSLFPVPEGFKLSVVVPVYNEKQWIREILRRIRDVPIPKEVIIVDDFSTDGTRDILKELQLPDVRVFYQPHNQGKGAALREGFRHVSGEVVVVQDADLEYDPAEFPRLIQPIIDGRADVVIGSRFIGDSHRVLYFWHSVANKGLTLLSNMFTNLNLTDMETCYKVFRREVLAGIHLKSNRFGFEPEITAKIAKKRNPAWRIYEVPISYSGRTYEEGKKIGLRDAFNALYCIIRFWMFD